MDYDECYVNILNNFTIQLGWIVMLGSRTP